MSLRNACAFYISYSRLCELFSFMQTHVIHRYIVTSTPTAQREKSRLRHNHLSYIRHYRCTYLEYYNYASSDEFKLPCQKESNEFLHEDFTESNSPDIFLGVQPQTLHKLRCLFSSLIHFPFIQIIFTGLHFKFAPKKKKKRKNPFAGNT